MKKYILGVAVLIMINITSCGKVDEEAQQVIDKINTIGTVDYDDEVLIGEIEEDYLALTDEQKEQVSNFNMLSEAREELDALLAAKPIPFSYANWETTTDELKNMMEKSPNSEYDTDDYHVVQYNDCEYEGYIGIVRYCFDDRRLVQVLFCIDGFEQDTYDYFNNLFTSKYGEPGYENEIGRVWHTANANVGLVGVSVLGGKIQCTFHEPVEE